ncbi:MAG TPA: alpha/beta hydrolase, partial [Burkholderiaceae bacterium]|nr:alpha/beta hydrolase [Burkholderiaceae bacterium]
MTARRWLFGIVATTGLLLPVVAMAQQPTVHRDLPYVSMTQKDVAARQQSLDLFLPTKTGARKAPLVVFIHGGFWQDSDDRHGIGDALAQALVPRGAAVALVRYPLAPAHKFPAQPEHIARALSFLHRSADTYGYDVKRIFLMGHSAGAHLASLVALDERYLRDVGLPADALAGIVAISGIYDLRSGGSIAHRA